MAVEAGDRGEATQIAQRLGSVVGPPSPLWVDLPKRYVGEHHDRGAGGESGNVLLEPGKLVAAKRSEATWFQVQHVHEADEVDAFVEAVPAVPLRVLAVPVVEVLSVIDEHVMLARHEEPPAGIHLLQHLIEGIELVVLAQVAQVAGVDHQVRPGIGGVDLGDCRAESAEDILVRVLAEADVAIADLDEAQGRSGLGVRRACGALRIWEITSPPTTASPTAAPNHAEWRISCRRVMPRGSRSAVIWSPPRCRA